jgi:hypothetical protein
METKNERISVGYSVGDHPEKENTIIITISDTGINITNERQRLFLEGLIRQIGVQMYAYANNISLKNIECQHVFDEFNGIVKCIYCGEWKKN